MSPLCETTYQYADEWNAAGKTPRTATSTGCHIRRFADFIDPAATVADFTEANLRSWVRDMERRKLRPRTVTAFIIAARSFGRWAVEKGLLTDNPALLLKKPKLDPPRRKLCTDEELFALLDGCDRIKNPRRAALVRAVLSVYIFTGCRHAECLNLEVGDVDLDEGVLHIRHGKGDKPRDCFLCDEAADALRAWLDVRGTCRHEYLWDHDHARRVSDNGLNTILRDARFAAGMPDADHLLPHSMRHAYACRLLQNGADLDAIREALGHSSLVVTSMYLHTLTPRKKQTAQLAGRNVQPVERQQGPAAQAAQSARPGRRSVSLWLK